MTNSHSQMGTLINASALIYHANNEENLLHYSTATQTPPQDIKSHCEISWTTFLESAGILSLLLLCPQANTALSRNMVNKS